MAGAEHSNEQRILAILFRAGANTPASRNQLYLQLAAHYERALTDSGLTRNGEAYYDRMYALDQACARVENWLSVQTGETVRNLPVLYASPPPRPSAPDRGYAGLAFRLAGLLVAAGLATSFVQRVPERVQATPIYIMGPMQKFVAAPGNEVEQVPDGTLIRSSLANADSGGTPTGAYLQLSPAVEEAASGNLIRVVVAARQADENPSPSMAVSYSTAGVGNSGWQRFELDKDFGVYSFTYPVGTRYGQPGPDYIGVWADPEGLGRGVVVGAMRVVVEPKHE